MRLGETITSVWQFSVIALASWLCMACPPATLAQTAQPVTKSFDFRNGTVGWQAGFSDYPPATDQNDLYELRAEIKNLPPELGVSGTGYYIQGDNHSDDLFMFLKRRLDRNDGIVAGQTYQITFTIVFASNAQSGCGGVGGSPGESVYLKAGGSPAEPKTLFAKPTVFPWLRMNVDKSDQAQSGIAASVTGNIANGQPCNINQRPYVSIQRTHQHTSLVNANSRGELWLLVGTDSGFEAITGLYYQQIHVSLVPVNQQPPVLLSYLNRQFEYTGKATALESVSLMSEPFAVTSPQNLFSTDQRTRLTLFGYNLELKDGEIPAVITVEAIDSQNVTYVLPVEAVNEVPDFNWITQVTVCLTDDLRGRGDLSLAVKLRSVKSNQLPIAMR
ncbi:MAG TPA: hypothetical protein VFX97_11660 [Pyrinomonadaceae bacterium]|nr:hypothetical protein [Pyrinomonadaceae bacterium]